MDESPASGNISRSGRIRKKSTKLADFESPDEITENPKVRRKNDQGLGLAAPAEPFAAASPSPSPSPASSTRRKIAQEAEPFKVAPQNFSLSDLEALADENADEDIRELMIDDTRGSRRSLPKRRCQNPKPDQNQTLPAFLLWAKSKLPELTQNHPNLSEVSTKQMLVEIWDGQTDMAEKELWKKKALQLEEKNPNAFVQKATTNIQSSSPGGLVLQQKIAKGPQSSSPVKTSPYKLPTSMNPALFKVVGTEPLDAAAHLKLLGESLTVIGDRLKEHEGQIAVSGSLSVLLDSLLCAMGPLMCLTSQVPELNCIEPRVLTQILDNVAYIMPGL